MHLVPGQSPHGLAHLQNTVHSGKTSQITSKCVAQSFTSPTLLTQPQLASLPAGLHCLKNGSIVSQLQRGSWLLPHSHANTLLLLLAAQWLEQARPQNLLISTKWSKNCTSPSQESHLIIFFSTKTLSQSTTLLKSNERKNIFKACSSYCTLNKVYFIIQPL